MDIRFEKQLSFLTEIDKMKTVLRQTMLIDKSRQETDAEHSWHFAVTAITLYEYAADPGVDINRVVRMALLHDLVEIYAGDTFAYDAKGNQSKEKREKDAADRLFSLLPEEQGAEYRALWEEFDAMETPDALYASAIDRLQPFINNSMTQGYTWVKHGVKKESVLKRMAPIRAALPALWGFVEQVIADACEKGYLKE
jgi:putative hydrolase of HD superfamily